MLIGLEAAGGAAVAHQRPRGLIQSPLHGLAVLLVREALAGQPARGCHQRSLMAQVGDVAVARLGGAEASAAISSGSTGVPPSAMMASSTSMEGDSA